MKAFFYVTVNFDLDDSDLNLCRSTAFPTRLHVDPARIQAPRL